MPDKSAHPLDGCSLTATLARSGGELARRHEALWQAIWEQGHVPATTLELCRLRLARLHGAAREFEASPPLGPPAGVDSGKIAGVLAGRWTREPCFSPAECAALEFAEIYGQDPQAITDELAEEVKTHFGEAGLVALIEALGVIDGRIRLGMMLGALLPLAEAAHD